MSEYLPYFDKLEQKYKDIYMEWSKEELIDHLVANIKNGEVLLERINKAIEYIEDNSDDMHTFISQVITQILKGSDKE